MRSIFQSVKQTTRRAALLWAGALFFALPTIADAQDARPFDVIQASYQPYMTAGDPLAFPMKVRSLSGDPYTFWRGSKDLFYFWCKTNTADWLADKQSYVASHGDLHFGNMGTYATEGRFGDVAFGAVDFDEACDLPFQIEILQGLITLRLTARKNQLFVSDQQFGELVDGLITSYRTALQGSDTTTAALADDRLIKTMIAAAKDSSYKKDELKKFIKNDKFVPSVYNKKGDLRGLPKDILRPAMDRADDVAGGIAQALVNSPRLAAMFRYNSAGDIRKAIKDVALRTRVASSGSQGLKKIFVLLDTPLKNVDHDVIVYLKQEIPTAAERAGAVQRRDITPGQRAAQITELWSDPKLIANSWCEAGSDSFWVLIEEPFSEDLAPDQFPEYLDLQHAAAIWGTVAGTAHRKSPNGPGLAAKLTPQLVTLLRDRCMAYSLKLDTDFSDFLRDPRGADLRQLAQKEIFRLAPIKKEQD